MRWRWPPDRRRGRTSRNRAGSSTRSEQFLAALVDLLAGNHAVDPQQFRQGLAGRSWTGSTNEPGSWNTIWILCRRRRDRRSPSSLPAKLILPADGASRPTRTLATVDLPQPLSPTMPRLRPLGTEKLTESTAVSSAARAPQPAEPGLVHVEAHGERLHGQRSIGPILAGAVQGCGHAHRTPRSSMGADTSRRPTVAGTLQPVGRTEAVSHHMLAAVGEPAARAGERPRIRRPAANAGQGLDGGVDHRSGVHQGMGGRDAGDAGRVSRPGRPR